MKNRIFTMLFISASMFIAVSSTAQVNLSVSIGNQPAWAPAGYDNAQYYYMPDIDAYYDVPGREFVYLNNKHWMHSTTLPAAYRRYDLYQIHKVPLNQRNAYVNYDRDRKQYAQFRGKYDQQSIRDSRNEKYSGNNNRKDNKFNNDSRNNGKDNRHQDDRRENSSRR